MLDNMTAGPAKQPVKPVAKPLAMAAPTPARITWCEPAQSFARFSLLRLRRTIATYGLYHFWGKAEAKKRIYSAIRIDGMPLSYHGTGYEMFQRFLSLAAVFGVVALMLLGVLIYKWLYPGPSQIPHFRLFRLAAVVPTIFGLGVMVWRAKVFELERTRWAGQAFRLPDAPWRYAWLHLWTAALIPLTLLWIIPWRSARLHFEITNQISHGGRRFKFDAGACAGASANYKRFAIAWVGGISIYLAGVLALAFVMGPEIVAADQSGEWSTLLTPGNLLIAVPIVAGSVLAFGALAAWYRAGTLNLYAGGTTFGGVRFELSLPPLRFAALTVTNRLLKLFTLGIASPVADARAMRFIVQHARLEGVGPSAPLKHGCYVATSGLSPDRRDA